MQDPFPEEGAFARLGVRISSETTVSPEELEDILGVEAPMEIGGSSAEPLPPEMGPPQPALGPGAPSTSEGEGEMDPDVREDMVSMLRQRAVERDDRAQQFHETAVKRNDMSAGIMGGPRIG